MSKKILFRADGNSSTGLGHLYRLFALVEIYKDSYDFVFITKENSILSVIPKTYNLKLIPNKINIEEEPRWLNDNFSSEKHIIIADGYHFKSNYQKKIKEFGYFMIYFDDLAIEYMYADIVINHSPYISKKDFNSETYVDFALGANYAALRPSFLEQAKLNRSINVIDSVFICFGGADPYNLTLKALKGLLEIPNFKSINIVIGEAYNFKEIYSIKQDNLEKINIFKNLSEKELVSVMLQSNYAIVPASTILYELCCVKMPVLSGFYVDNQKLIYKGFVNTNSVYEGGDFQEYSVSNFKSATEKILKYKDYKNQIHSQKKMFDNEINERYFKLIKNV